MQQSEQLIQHLGAEKSELEACNAVLIQLGGQSEQLIQQLRAENSKLDDLMAERERENVIRELELCSTKRNI